MRRLVLLAGLLSAFIVGSLLTTHVEAQGANVTLWGTDANGVARRVLTDTTGILQTAGQ